MTFFVRKHKTIATSGGKTDHAVPSTFIPPNKVCGCYYYSLVCPTRYVATFEREGNDRVIRLSRGGTFSNARTENLSKLAPALSDPRSISLYLLEYK
ncbi:hypothetical protein, partial [Pseudothermotoga sp.]